MKWLLTSIMQLLFTICMYIIGTIIIGISIFPSVLLCLKLWRATAFLVLIPRVFILCLGIVGGYFIFGICLMFVLGIVRIVFNLRLKEGEYPMYSFGALKWAVVNSLVLVLANTFMDFMLLTPFINIFYRLMGAKLGKNVQINSKFCADLSLLEIGDNAVIGGHATVIGHSFERGRLILKKVKIGKRVLIGLNSVVLPGAEIGDGSLISAGAVLSKNTKTDPRSVYYGVPAESVKERRERDNL